MGAVFGGVFGRGDVAVGDTAWLQAMLDAEAGLARALERAGLVAAGAGQAVTAAASAANFDPATFGTELTGNPVPGLARALARQVPGTAAGAVHRGATSQDIIDTAMMLLARQVIRATMADLARAAEAAAGLAVRHRNTIMIGRTLLQQAVPVTFGLVAAGWLTALDEARGGLASVQATRLAVQFGGAAGTLASLGTEGPQVAALMAEELGLALPVLPWHTDRLRILDISTSLARASAVLGKIARDITLLAQNEIAELRESSGPPDPSGSGGHGGAAEGQRPELPRPGSGGHGGADSPPVRRGGLGGIVPPREIVPPLIDGGSSAMPHKRNPVAAVAVLGCTRQVPGLLATLAASAEHEQQRAAGAWHAEWEPYTALLRLTQSGAAWGAELLLGLVVDAPRMAANLAATEGLPLAEHVTALISGVLGAPRAHDLVARASERAASSGLLLRDVLLGLPELADTLAAAGITPEQVEAALEPAGYLGATQVFIDAALAAHGGGGYG